MTNNNMIFFNNESKEKFEKKQQRSNKMEKKSLEFKEVDLDFIYKVDKNLYWRFTTFLESGEIYDVYYRDYGETVFFYFNISGSVIDIVRIHKQSKASDNEIEHTVIDKDEFKNLKSVGHTKKKNKTEPTLYSGLIKKQDKSETYDPTEKYLISNKLYDVYYLNDGDKDYTVMTVKGCEVNESVRKIKSEGYNIGNISENKQYLKKEDEKNKVSMNRILSSLNYHSNEHLDTIIQQCKALKEVRSMRK